MSAMSGAEGGLGTPGGRLRPAGGQPERGVRGRYPLRMPSRPTRRSVLAAALAAPAATAVGCTLSGPTPARSSAREAPDVDPDVALLEQVSKATTEVVALYEAVIDEHRGLRDGLRPLLAAHRAHEEALGEAAPPESARDRRDARRGNGSSARTPDAPRRSEQAVAQLESTERDTSRRLLEATRDARSGGFARLLASMSASSAQAVLVLGELSEGGG